MNKVNFQYFAPQEDEIRVFPKLKNLCLTIATQIHQLEDGYNVVKWSIAFKNPNDKFSKEIARQVASDNLETMGNYGEFIVARKFTRAEVVAKIFAILFYDELHSIPASYKAYVRMLLLKTLYNSDLV